MDELLDTCCLIWAVSEPRSLTNAVVELLEAEDTHVHVSCICCAEIACLAERQRIHLDRHWRLWFDHYVALNGWQVLDVSLDVIQEAWSLPGEFHQDPADRVLVGTARLNRQTLVTGDRKILNYPHVATLW